MTDNFFTDNLDLQRYLKKIDLSEVVGILEDGYRYHEEYDAAPRNYADAMDNYRLMLEVVGDICANHAAPRAAEADEVGVSCEDGRVIYADATLEAMRFLRQADIVGATLPWEYGGMNLPETVLQMVVEIMSRADASLMTVFGLQEIAAKMIAEHGDEEMKARVLPRVISGELVGGAMVLTEPDAGSDLGSVQTRATYDEETGEWRLNGVKRFITNGCSDVLLVLARSEEGSADARGLSFFEAEADETVRIRRTEHKMGLHASPTCEMQFDNTPARLIGKQRFGLIRYAMAMMNVARLAIASQALGIAEAAYREAYQYAQKRVQFGSSIDQIPAVYRMLLSMRAEIEATRALIYETARWVDLAKAYERQKERGELDSEGRQRLKEAGRLSDVLTPLVKYYATEMGNKVCYQAMQIHGGTGYMREFNVERHYRDVRITNIYEGTSQLQVVAAIGGLLGHALDGLLEGYAAQDYGTELADLKGQLQEATALFNRCIDHLKEAERVAVDYYGSDAVEVATYLLNGWLVLQDGAASVDAAASERKRDLARVYIGEALPQIRARIDVLRAIDPTPVQAKESVLTDEF
ncbi:MAG: acyl-CoA dehydrogenase family protein [Anaerolineae bacterium]|jgi:alkylation response protein AidB-like acyl-CoA dehydrogenase